MAQPAATAIKPSKPSRSSKSSKSEQSPPQEPQLTLVASPKKGKRTGKRTVTPPKVDGRKAHRTGPCPHCGKRVAFFPTGTARPHIDPNSPTGERCPATAKNVFELLADVMANVEVERSHLRDMSQAALDFAGVLVTQSEAYVAASQTTTEMIKKVVAELNRMGEGKTKAL